MRYFEMVKILQEETFASIKVQRLILELVITK